MFLALLCVFAAGIATACGTQRTGKPATGVATITGHNTTTELTFVDSAILTIPPPRALTSTATTTDRGSSCTFSIIEQAGSESACVDSAGDCHAHAYVTLPLKRELVLTELHGARAERVCRDLALQKPK